MLGEDQDALVCDMAETYHVLDIWALPVEQLATLASGLREHSRIKMKIAGLNYIPVEIVMPHIADTLTKVFTKEGTEKPVLYSEIMLGTQTEEKTAGFDSGEEFEQERKRIIRGTRYG